MLLKPGLNPAFCEISGRSAALQLDSHPAWKGAHPAGEPAAGGRDPSSRPARLPSSPAGAEVPGGHLSFPWGAALSGRISLPSYVFTRLFPCSRRGSPARGVRPVFPESRGSLTGGGRDGRAGGGGRLLGARCLCVGAARPSRPPRGSPKRRRPLPPLLVFATLPLCFPPKVTAGRGPGPALPGRGGLRGG